MTKKWSLLLQTMIETLKWQKSKCSKSEVFRLVKDTMKGNVNIEIFDKTLDSLIESVSAK